MPLPDCSNGTLSDEDSLAVQAAHLAALRTRVQAMQSKFGATDVGLIAEFAEAQKNYLESKIRFEERRLAKLDYERSVHAAMEAERSSAAAVAPAEETRASPARTERRLLAGSRHFWAVVIFLLGALACFLHSPYSYPYP
jgi:hypothetical protein